jgi:hypothetical protein
VGGMILIAPPANVKHLLNQYLFEVADKITVQEIKNTLNRYYGHEIPLKIKVGYDYYGYLDIRFEFETEEDAVIFKLKYAI